MTQCCRYQAYEYYRCQGYGHLTSECPSQIKTLFVKVSIEDIEEWMMEKWLCTNKMMTRMSQSKSVNSMGALEL